MADKPEAGGKENKSENEVKKAPQGGIVDSSVPALANQPQTQNAKKPIEYGKYVVWPFKALWWLIRWFFRFFDVNQGAVTALATIAIAFLTWKYVTYSRGQLKVIDGQLKEMQQADRPYIFAQPIYGANGPNKVPKFNEFPITMDLYDAGTSPAIRVIASTPEILITKDAGVAEKIKNCSFSYEGHSEMAIPPGIPNGTFLPTVHSRFISDTERDESILLRIEFIVIIGAVKYSGMRGGEFETTYSFAWIPESLSNPNSLPFGHLSDSCNHMK